MPSSSAAQHRFFGAMHSHPEEAARHGLSEAKVSEWLHSDRGSPWAHASGGGVAGYDFGGAVDPAQSGGVGGLAPSNATMNPMTRNLVQRYSSLPTEKLQELSQAVGNSPQGQVLNSLLQQRRLQPNAQSQGQPGGQAAVPGAPSAPAAPAVRRGGVIRRDVGGATPPTLVAPSSAAGLPPQGMPPAGMPQRAVARGGPVRRAGGGDMGISPSQASPWWERSEARGAVGGGGGFLAGATPGRADSISTTAPAGAYVIPADVVAGLGEGNSLSGARVLQEIMSSGPYGTPVGRQGPSRGLPHPVAPMQTPSQAKGGATPPAAGAPPGHVSVLLSHGEFVVHPDDVRRIGRGNLTLGHRILDRWIERERDRQIKKLKALPGPVKSAA